MSWLWVSTVLLAFLSVLWIVVWLSDQEKR